jgi:hypothetical protein
MCNCGNKRNTYAGQAYKLSNEMTNEPVKKMWNDKKFQYIGQTALTVTGGITRKKYRFTHSGDIQLIDYRDASGMMAIPCLVLK